MGDGNVTSSVCLKGVKVLVPRPFPQGKPICELIEECGGEAIYFPVIDIKKSSDISTLKRKLQSLQTINLIVLISVSAVLAVARILDQYDIAIPSTAKVAAIGHKTAQQCLKLGIKVDYVPSQQIDSEGLISALEDFRIEGSRIAIFRGQSGREMLKEALVSKGAKVEYVESYHRALTTLPIQPIVKRWRNGEIDLVIITSNSIVDGLMALLGENQELLLERTPVVAISRRIADYCRKVGVTSEVIVSTSPGDEDVLETIIKINQRVT